MKKTMMLMGAVALMLALAMPALAATRLTWKTSTRTSVNVRKGTTVKLVWGDRAPHNVRGLTGVITGKGRSWSHRFNRSVTLYCDLHPGMRLRINVR